MKKCKRSLIALCLVLMVTLVANVAVFAGDEFDPRGCCVVNIPVETVTVQK